MEVRGYVVGEERTSVDTLNHSGDYILISCTILVFCNTCLDFNIMRYLCEIGYDGTKYNGFKNNLTRKQFNGKLNKLCSVFKKIKIFASKN